MHEPGPPAPPDPGLVALIEALAVGDDCVAVLVGLRPDHAMLRLLSSPGLLLAFRAEVLADPTYRRAVGHGAAELGVEALQLVAVGAGPDTAAHLRDLREHIPRGSVDLATVSTDGVATRLTRGALPGPLFPRLEGLSLAPWSHELAERVVREAQAGGDRVYGDHNAFVTRMRDRRPLVTIALAVVLGAVGLTEWALGAFEPDGVYVMAAMGGIVPGHALDRPWTLLAYALLHGGPVHLGMNTYVLWILGGQLERIVGGGRVLAVFTAGALGGGLAAALFGQGVTIGASGGVWGLLVAQGWLGFFPGGLLPRSVVAIVRKNAARNLVINLLISFVPGVSMAGHIGGGLGGLLASGAGLLAGGVRADEPATASLGHPVQAGLGLGCAVALLAALAVAWLDGEPRLVAELVRTGQLPP